ncbi:MAG: Ig domain-containing protein, partial [Limisphaerales bacterium]
DGTNPNTGSNVERLDVNVAPVINAQNRTVGLGKNFHYVLPVTDDFSVQAAPFQNFDAFNPGVSRVMFHAPLTSGSTTNNINTNFPSYTSVTNVYPAGHSSSNVLNVRWTYRDDSAWPWVRLTTSGVTNTLNPVVSFTQRLRFDIHVNRMLGVALGLRETNTQNPIGGNGGGSGALEFVGVSDANPTPVRYVTANEWTTLDFNIPEEQVRAFPGSGNGTLLSTTGKGVLEHLALVWGDFAEFMFDYDVYLDNFVVVPTNHLTFALDSAPAGAKIDPVTGIISWTAPNSATTQTFYVRVTDSFGMTSTASFNVEVSDAVVPPGPISISRSGNNVVLTWSGNFILQSAPEVTGPWTDIGGSSGQSITPSSQRVFYRLRN